MKLQYIELYRNQNGKGERVYQGVAFGEKDAASQMNTVKENAISLGETVVEVDPRLWEIFSADGSMWGRVQLRAF
jgi:hypothetical protein